jgi:hypothetical protein
MNACFCILEIQKQRDQLEDRHRWEDNIRMDHREIGWEGVTWVHLAKDQWQALVKMVITLWVA